MPQGLATGSKAAEQDLAGVLLVVGALVRHAQHRQPRGRPAIGSVTM